jgi:hypothetical protein
MELEQYIRHVKRFGPESVLEVALEDLDNKQAETLAKQIDDLRRAKK